MRTRTVINRDSVADFFDDFFNYTAGRYTATTDGATGTPAVSAVAGGTGGWLNLLTAAAADDYHLFSSSKFVELVASKPVTFEARFKITEAAANSAHFVFGLSDTLTTGFMADTTGEPPASWDGSVVYKPAGAALFKHKTSNGSTASTTTNIGTFVSGSVFTVGLSFDPGDGTTGTVQPFVNGMGTKTNFDKLPKHRVLLASFGPASIVWGVKASTAAVETLSVDYVDCQMTR